MRVQVAENVLTVVTDISVAAAAKELTDPVVLDEKKQPIYRVAFDPSGARVELSKFGIVANAVIDGNLAVVITEKMGITKDEIKQKYGKALVNAKKFCPIIAAAAAEAQAEIDEVFAD